MTDFKLIEVDRFIISSDVQRKKKEKIFRVNIYILFEVSLNCSQNFCFILLFFFFGCYGVSVIESGRLTLENIGNGLFMESFL